MALFDLRCQDCGEAFEKFVPYARLSEVTCPSCKSKNHERVYQANVKGNVRISSGSRSTAPSIPTSGFS